MIGKIHPGLLVAGGLGAAGVGYLMFKGKGDEAGAEGEQAAPGTSPGSPAAPGTGAMPGAAPGMAVPGAANGLALGDAGAGTGGMPSAGTTGGAGQLQGEQVGPYTIVSDPSGVDLVFETATQQPVGVLDGQGNLRPVTVGPDGSISLAQEQSTASTLGPAPHPGAGATSGATRSAAPTESDAVYARMAAELFAGASNLAIGAATSDAMTGATAISPQAMTAAGTVTPAGGGQPIAGAAGVQSQQVGEFTLVDDGSGITQVFDTASRQLLGTMDQAGNVTPVGGTATGPTATGTTGPATPAAMGASVPATSQGSLPAMAG